MVPIPAKIGRLKNVRIRLCIRRRNQQRTKVYGGADSQGFERDRLGREHRRRTVAHLMERDVSILVRSFRNLVER